MKKKGLIAVAALALVAVIAVVVVIVVSKGYRVIKVDSMEGQVTLERASEEKAVFEGLKLKSEDSMTTGEDGLLELLVDNDKHILAKENTSFTIQSTGNKKKGKLTIKLEYGTGLVEIENKLPDGYDVELETPNATMSVRGTTFEVVYDKITKITTLIVTEGKVRVKTSDDMITVEGGQGAVIEGAEIKLADPDAIVEIVKPESSADESGVAEGDEGASAGEAEDEGTIAKPEGSESATTGPESGKEDIPVTPPGYKQYLMNDDFPPLLKGGSSYEQMRYMIKIALIADMNGHKDYLKEALFLMCHEGYRTEVFPPVEGTENVYDIDMLNNMFSFLTDETIEEKHLNTGSTIDGNLLTTYKDYSQKPDFTAIGLASMYYGEDGGIVIEFIAEKHTMVDGASGPILDFEGTAYLVKDETGKYVFDHLEWQESEKEE